MPTTGITISGEERNALFNQIADRLTGIDVVYTSLEVRDWETAQRVGQEFADLLRFLCEDIGWGEGGDDVYVLTSPPNVLQRVIGFVHKAALADREVHERERDEAGDDVTEAKQLQEMCERILGSVGANKQR
jgi:hypothetical protein